MGMPSSPDQMPQVQQFLYPLPGLPIPDDKGMDITPIVVAVITVVGSVVVAYLSLRKK